MSKPITHILIFFALIASLLVSAAGSAPAHSAAGFTNRTTANGLGSNSVQGVFVSGSTVYAATAEGLSISTDGGNTFTNRTTANGLGSDYVHSVFASGNTVYAATSDGLSISSDGGNTFTNKTIADGLGANDVQGVFASGNSIYAATPRGLSISSDGGGAFVNKTNLDGLGATGWTEDVFANGSTVYAATMGGLSISSDGGNTFTNKTAANGLSDTILKGVFVSGSNVYAATTSSGISISRDGGNTFINRTIADGLGDSWVFGVFASDRAIYAATPHGLSISTDGGSTFTNKTAADGLGSDITHAVFVSNGVIYVATGDGLSIGYEANTLAPSSTKTATPAALDPSPGLDVVLLIDTSESMAWGWADEKKANAERDPKACNEDDPDGAVSGDGIDGNCFPFQDIKQAAINFVNRLHFPQDRVGIVSFNQHATVSLPLSDDPAVIETAIQHIRIYEGMGPCQYYRDDPTLNATEPSNQSSVPPFPYRSAAEITGSCRFFDNPGGNFLGMNCPMAYGPNPSWYMCGNTNTSEGFVYAGNTLAGIYPGSICGTNCPPVRDSSRRIIIVLSDGAPNSAFDVNGAPICPGYTQTWAWLNNNGQACRDSDSAVRHTAKDALYDADDYARDMIDLVVKNKTIIYSIGMPGVALKRSTWVGDPPAQAVLQYAARSGAGEYNAVETPDQLDTIFLDIFNKLDTGLPPNIKPTEAGSETETPSLGVTPTAIFQPSADLILTSTPLNTSTAIIVPGTPTLSAPPVSTAPPTMASILISIGCASIIMILLGILLLAMREKKI